jgi:hypothetical protein
LYKGTTPKKITGVSTGTHTIKLSKSGYKDYTKKISVKAGETKRINANLIQRLIIREELKEDVGEAAQELKEAP